MGLAALSQSSIVQLLFLVQSYSLFPIVNASASKPASFLFEFATSAFSRLSYLLHAPHLFNNNLTQYHPFLILLPYSDIFAVKMSARRRGQARGNAADTSDPQARRGPNPARGRVAPFDGPASRGSGSGGGSQSRTSAPPTSNPRSRQGSDAGQSQGNTQAGLQPAAEVAPQAPRDPALEAPRARATDSIKNIDMPASFYNIDGLVSYMFFRHVSIEHTHQQTLMSLFQSVSSACCTSYMLPVIQLPQ